jgi:lactam utilization protein B
MFKTKVVVAAIGVIVLLLVVGGVAFAAGSEYGKTQAQNVRNEFLQQRFGNQGGQSGQAQPGQNDQTGQRGQAGQFGRIAANGTVKSVDGNKITLTMQNGNTVTVNVDQQTRITKTVAATSSDIQAGTRILVTSDQTGNNVTARAITIEPAQATQ